MLLIDSLAVQTAVVELTPAFDFVALGKALKNNELFPRGQYEFDGTKLEHLELFNWSGGNYDLAIVSLENSDTSNTFVQHYLVNCEGVVLSTAVTFYFFGPGECKADGDCPDYIIPTLTQMLDRVGKSFFI